MPEIAANKYELADNTFTAKEKSFAAVEVGDAKQPDVFYPQVKIMRWDNEVNFSVRLVTEAPPAAVGIPEEVAAVQAAASQKITGGNLEDSPPLRTEVVPAVAQVEDKVVWATPAVEAHFYQVGDGKDGDSFEFEIILNKPPASNVIQMTLQTKGLDFFYQPALTDEQISSGISCPDSVPGSYAVYHKTMAGDFTALGGKNYRTGKFCHIFRPQLFDANGVSAWGELNIDVDAGLLRVTIPQDFLDKAVYPVRHAAGLEFGYHTLGYYQFRYDRGYGALYQAPDNGNISSITAGLFYSGDYNFNVGYFNDNSGIIGTHVAHGTAASAVADWNTIDVAGSIVSNHYYWLMVQYSDVNVSGLCMDWVGSGSFSRTSYMEDFDVWTDNQIPGAYAANFFASIYATYSESGGGTAKIPWCFFNQAALGQGVA